MRISHFNSGVLLPTCSLWQREVVRFVRQRSRIISALGTPILFWLLIGSGLKNSFRLPEQATSMNYLQYAFPGTLVLIVLFSSIFSTISLIEDRREGFLQAVLVAPVSRLAVVLGKILGSSTLAVAQALVFMLLAPLAGLPLRVGSFSVALAVLIVMSVGLAGLAFRIAWAMESIQGFHAIMNLFLLPLWLLSGAFFPATGASSWVAWLMWVNPLTYGVAALRYALYWGADHSHAGLPSPVLASVVTAAFTLVMTGLAVAAVKRK